MLRWLTEGLLAAAFLLLVLMFVGVAAVAAVLFFVLAPRLALALMRR